MKTTFHKVSIVNVLETKNFMGGPIWNWGEHMIPNTIVYLRWPIGPSVIKVLRYNLFYFKVLIFINEILRTNQFNLKIKRNFKFSESNFDRISMSLTKIWN